VAGQQQQQQQQQQTNNKDAVVESDVSGARGGRREERGPLGYSVATTVLQLRGFIKISFNSSQTEP
jgi:hypothetical protein